MIKNVYILVKKHEGEITWKIRVGGDAIKMDPEEIGKQGVN